MGKVKGCWGEGKENDRASHIQNRITRARLEIVIVIVIVIPMHFLHCQMR